MRWMLVPKDTTFSSYIRFVTAWGIGWWRQKSHTHTSLWEMEERSQAALNSKGWLCDETWALTFRSIRPSHLKCTRAHLTVTEGTEKTLDYVGRFVLYVSYTLMLVQILWYALQWTGESTLLATFQGNFVENVFIYKKRLFWKILVAHVSHERKVKCQSHLQHSQQKHYEDGNTVFSPIEQVSKILSCTQRWNKETWSLQVGWYSVFFNWAQKDNLNFRFILDIRVYQHKFISRVGPKGDTLY